MNEGGRGDIRLTIKQSDLVGNGADGLELDEKGDGDATLKVVATTFRENGPKDPTDLDDGLDVDEDGDGAITGRIVNTEFVDNLDQGLDLNENAAGDLRVTIVNVDAIGNGQEGIDLEEDDDVNGGGDLVADLVNVTIDDNGFADPTDGLKIEEDGVGSLVATITDTTADDNAAAGATFEQQQSDPADCGLGDALGLHRHGQPRRPLRHRRHRHRQLIDSPPPLLVDHAGRGVPIPRAGRGRARSPLHCVGARARRAWWP